MPYSRQEIKIINKVYCLFIDNLKCIENWGFYLFDEAFNCEQELRNRLGVIWLASLFDSIRTEMKHVEEFRRQAEEAQLIHMPRYCDQVLEFFDSIKEIINKYTKQEQVFIVHMRDQLVHSFLSGRHNDEITIKFMEDGEFKKEKISIDDFGGLVQPLFEAGILDDTLKVLISRFTDRSSRYWLILGEIQRNHELMYKAMQSGSEFQFSTISV